MGYGPDSTGPDASELGRELAYQLESAALTQAANRQLFVTQVQTTHRDVVRSVVSTILVAPDQQQAAMAAAQSVIASMGSARAERFDSTMQVGNIDSAGLSKGSQVFVAPDYAAAGMNAAVATEINDHELRHKGQAKSYVDVGLSTGDPTADRLLQVPGLAFLEHDAMQHAGFDHTVDWYVTDYYEPVQEIAAYVHGTQWQDGVVDGPQLVTWAAQTGDFATVRHVIVAAQQQRAAQQPAEPQAAPSVDAPGTAPVPAFAG